MTCLLIRRRSNNRIDGFEPPSGKDPPPQRPQGILQQVIAVAALLGFVAMCGGLTAQERLIDREPFDRIILDDANEGRVLDVAPLDFNERRVPDPLPRSESLRVRLIDRPLDEFDVRWANIAEIRLFEMLVLEEARGLAGGGQFKASQEYLSYIEREQPHFPGLSQAAEDILEAEAIDAFQRGDHERAWMVLTALFDRNPQRAGMDRALNSIADRLLESNVGTRDFRTARQYLGVLEKRFGPRGQAVAARWRERLHEMAAARLAAGRTDLASGNLDAARRRADEALAIEPGMAEARALARKVAAMRPSVVVAVVAEAPQQLTRRLDDWASTRIEPLVDPPLVELRGFGAEGGEYKSAYGDLLHDAGGTSTSLVFRPSASGDNLTAHAVARQLVAAAIGVAGRSTPAGGRPTDTTDMPESLAKILAEVAVDRANTLELTWKHPHVRPESLLRIGLSEIGMPNPDSASEGESPDWPGTRGPFAVKSRDENEVTYVRKGSLDERSRIAPVEIVERLFRSDDDAVDALLRGEVDVVDRVAATHVPRLTGRSGVVVGEYALPTVHVLVVSSANPLLQVPELRRAIIYGLNRQQIVEQLVISDGPTQSASVVSGPFPMGRDFADPVGYAYNRSIVPRAYDPRLAVTLAGVAARLDNSGEGDASEQMLSELTLAHPAEPLPRAACQMIKEQLAIVGIRVKLVEYRPDELPTQDADFDLRYAELAMWEPVVDAGRLFGLHGGLGRLSARMALALADVDEARTWQDVRQRLSDVHRVAHDELDLIPLWQTTNYFAYRDQLQGVASRPVTLYQDVGNWDLSGEHVEAAP